MEQMVGMVVSGQTLRVVAGLLVLSSVGAVIGALSRGFVRPLLCAALIIGGCLFLSTRAPGLWQGILATARNAWSNVSVVLQTASTDPASGNRAEAAAPAVRPDLDAQP